MQLEQKLRRDAQVAEMVADSGAASDVREILRLMPATLSSAADEIARLQKAGGIAPTAQRTARLAWMRRMLRAPK